MLSSTGVSFKERILICCVFDFLAGLLHSPWPQAAKPRPPHRPTDPALTRRIEVMVRSQFSVPPDYRCRCSATRRAQPDSGIRQPAGHALPRRKNTVIDFLISTDNSKLARLETFDLAKNPAFNIDVAGRPIRGNPDAKVTIINFDDLECPYCARMHQTLLP